MTGSQTVVCQVCTSVHVCIALDERIRSSADQLFLRRLDVDKDHFDKFSMRNCIDLILLELWKDPGSCQPQCAISATA